MPDISMLGRRHPRPEQEKEQTPESDSEDEPPPSTGPIVVPDACLACGKEKVTHSAIPCRHPCFCRACAMKMATGGRCKPNVCRVEKIRDSKYCVGELDGVYYT